MKLKGRIGEVKPVIERLKRRGLYLSDDLACRLPSDVGEA